MYSYKCGHCGVMTARHDLNAEISSHWALSGCASCGRLTLINVREDAFYPPEGWDRVSNIEKVPEPIAKDYEEAVNALVAGLFKASATMSRRTVQGVCIDLGTSAKKTLVQQIDDLKDNNNITPRLANLAHTVRVLGNDGAHPRDDGLDEITKEEAQQGVEFVEHLLQHVYIL